MMTDLLTITGGRWLKAPSDIQAFSFCGVCDDSRQAKPGQLFVAIKGELSDGHKYIRQAAASGVAAVCVQDIPDDALLNAIPCPCLAVEDTMLAFQRLAQAHRRQFPSLKVIGVTGSCGKTSSKEMCAAILEHCWPGQVLKTEGNTNNYFGVPRNLLRITADTRCAVIEMGSNHPGEIARLVNLVEPDIGLVCNIGHAHLEFFHDLRGVATEKGDILAGTRKDGIAVIPGEAEGVDILRAKAGSRRIFTFGTRKDDDVRGEYLGYDENANAFRIRLTWKASGETRTFSWTIGGAHQAVNAAGAAAVATALAISPDDIVAGLQKCSLPGSRLNIIEADGVHWANDAYNANPDSTRAALEWFAEVSTKAKSQVLVLGEMRELGGEVAPKAHEDMLRLAHEKFPNGRIIAVGKQYQPSALSLGVEYYDTIENVLAIRNQLTIPGAWILLKGSNGVGVFKLAPKQ